MAESFFIAVVQGATAGIVGGILIGIGQIISKVYVEPWIVKFKRTHDKAIKKAKKRIKLP